jgi:hypothetical protein
LLRIRWVAADKPMLKEAEMIESVLELNIDRRTRCIAQKKD